MRALRKSKFIKIICSFLLAAFLVQPLALAETIDLKDGAGFEDYALAVAAGYMAATAVKPSWNAMQIFTYTYLIPAASSQIIKVTGLEGTSAIVGTAFLSTFLVSKLDYANSAVEQSGAAASDILSRVGKEFISSGAKAAFADATTAGVVAYAKAMVAKNVKNEALGQALGYLIGKYVGQHVRQGLQKASKVFAWYDPERGPTARSEKVDFDEQGERVYYKNEKREVESRDFASREEAAQFKLELAENKREFVNQETVTGARVWTGDGYRYMNFREALDYQQSTFKQQSRGDDARVAAQALLGLAGLKGEALILLSAGAGSWMAGGSLKEGLYRGAISAALQWMSTRTKSALHGAVFAAGASAVLQFAVLDKKNLSQEEASGRDLQLVQGKKDYELFKAIIALSVTNADADFMSFGRASPVLNSDGSEFNFRLHSGNDIFFISRYTDYVADVEKYGLTSAMTSQYASSYHNQAVSNIYSVINGDVNKQMYVKRLTGFYAQKLRATYKNLEEERTKLAKGLEKYSKEVLNSVGVDSLDGLKTDISELGEQIKSGQKEIRDLQQAIATTNDPEDRKQKDQQLKDKKQEVADKKTELSKKSAILNVLSSKDFDELRKAQAKKELPLASVLHVLAAFEPTLAGLGASTLGKDAIEAEINSYVTSIQSLKDSLNKSGVNDKDLEGLVNGGLDNAKKAKYDYLSQRADYNAMREAGGWQTLGGINGTPYTQIDPKVAATAKRLGIEIKSELPEEVIRQRIMATSEYKVNLENAIAETAANSELQAAVKKEALAITKQQLEANEKNKAATLNDEQLTGTNEYENNYNAILESKVSEVAPDKAFDLTTKQLNKDLLGTVEYHDLIGGSLRYFDRWKKNEPSKVEPTLPVVPISIGFDSADQFEALSWSQLPTQPANLAVFSWDQAPTERLENGETAAIGSSRILRFTGGIVPEQMAEQVKDISVGKDGVTYGKFAGEALVAKDKNGTWYALYDKDPAYSDIVSKAFGGSAAKYSKEIVDKISSGGNPSDRDAATKFAQHNPWLVEKAMSEAQLSDSQKEKVRVSVGISHLPTKEVKELAKYVLVVNKDTNKGKVYIVAKQDGKDHLVFVKDATTDQVRQYQMRGDAGSAKGGVDIGTGKVSVRYEGSPKDHQSSLERQLSPELQQEIKQMAAAEPVARGLSTLLRATAGVVPKQLEKDITDVKTVNGVTYGIFGGDTRVAQNSGGDWTAVFTPNKAYSPMIENKNGPYKGSYKAYAQDIVANLSSGDQKLSDVKTATTFAQHNPWLIEQAMARVKLDDAQKEKIRQSVGIAHLPTEPTKELNDYVLVLNKTDNTGKVYKLDADKQLKFERDATPDQIRQYQIRGDKFVATGKADIATGKAEITYSGKTKISPQQATINNTVGELGVATQRQKDAVKLSPMLQDIKVPNEAKQKIQSYLDGGISRSELETFITDFNQREKNKAQLQTQEVNLQKIPEKILENNQPLVEPKYSSVGSPEIIHNHIVDTTDIIGVSKTMPNEPKRTEWNTDN